MSTSFDSVDGVRNVVDGLIRKTVSGGAVLIAPVSAPLVNTLCDDQGKLLAQSGYVGLGRIAADGAPNFTREDNQEDVETWGELEPSRSDVTSSKLTVSFTLQDTRKEVLGLAARRDLDFMGGVQAGSNGEVVFTDNPQPDITYYRVLIVSQDGTGSNALFVARFLPRATITIGDENWDKSNAIVYPATLTAFKDQSAGYSSKRFYGGPGMNQVVQDGKTLAELMGFTRQVLPLGDN